MTYHVYRIVCSVTLHPYEHIGVNRKQETYYEHCIGDLVLANAPAENDHPRFPRLASELIQCTDIADYVDDKSRVFERVEVDHVAN